MTDRRTLKKNFVSAARDPFRVAEVLRIPPIAPAKGTPPSTSNSETLEIGGTDWGPVLTAWLDAWQAAEAVRECVISCV